MSVEKTLRDKFPISCQVCEQVILPSQRDENGELLAEGEPYRVIGMVPTYPGHGETPIPLSTYAHLYCLGVERYSPRPTSPVHLIYACQYCGEEIRNGDVCPTCRERIARESKTSDHAAALKELLENLAEMRAEAKPVEEPLPRDPHTISHSHGDKTPNSDQLAKQHAAGLLENPERLGVYEPTNEMGVVFMFGQVIGDLAYKMAYMDDAYPDCVVLSPTGKLVRVELEYRSSAFIFHKHDPALCDLVVCWLKDRDLPVPVLALHDYFDSRTGSFDFAGLNT